MISAIVSRLVILLFGTLYPAYASYKAVRTKNVKEYVKWMMYWIVFALFTCAETFTDVFLSFWFPFYYEIKIVLVLWLLSPATKGSSILYRKFVHPMLSRREQEIDEYIAKAKEQGYHTVLHLGTKGVNYATTVLMQTAIKGGGGLVNQLRRSYSLSDLSSDKESDMNRNSKSLKNAPDEDDMDEADGLDPRMLRPRGYSPRRSASGSGRVEMYFPEVDVDVRQHGSSRPREPSIPLSHIRSSEDVSSGYSSAEPLYAGHHATKSEGLAPSREPLVRTASMGSTRSMRTKSSRGGVVTKRGPAAEDSDFFDLPEDDADFSIREDSFYDKSSSMPSKLSQEMRLSSVSPPSTPLASVPEMPPQQTQSEQVPTQQQAVDSANGKPLKPEESDEDLPLFDAETDESKNESNAFSISESLSSTLKHDVSSLSVTKTPSSTDLTLEASAHPLVPPTEANSIDKSSFQNSQEPESTALNLSSSSAEENCAKDSQPTEITNTDVKQTEPSAEITCVPAQQVGSSHPEQSVQTKSENSAADHIYEEVTPQPPEQPMAIPSATSDITGEAASNTQPSVVKTDTTETGIVDDKNSTEENILQSPDESFSANASFDSISIADSSSRSNSQCSLRKEGRGGRYHKYAAPTPPSRTPELEEGTLIDCQILGPSKVDEEKSASLKETDSNDYNDSPVSGSSDSEVPVTTARLVLKPGVVKSLGPDTESKTEVFVSKTPQAKSKKSKSKHKQGDSGLSRLFHMSGSLTSLLPFWHGKPEGPEPAGRNLNQKSSKKDGEQTRAPLADSD